MADWDCSCGQPSQCGAEVRSRDSADVRSSQTTVETMKQHAALVLFFCQISFNFMIQVSSLQSDEFYLADVHTCIGLFYMHSVLKATLTFGAAL